jgi:hypothetical protein
MRIFPKFGALAMYDKKRGKAYREILAGVQFHQFEKLSLVTFGFQRGSEIDCRTVLKEMMTWIKRDFQFKTDYFRVEVWENKRDTDAWRVHVHMIWNAPYVRQQLIREKLELYIGENAHVDIRLLKGDPKNSARYLMQYLGNQEGKVYYTRSREWLPKGYNDEWLALKHDFFKRVKGIVKNGLKDDNQCLQVISHNDDTWRKEVLVNMMGEWIEKKALDRFTSYDFDEGEKNEV